MGAKGAGCFYLRRSSMSKASPPYYFKEDKTVDTYHWETSCSLNHYPAPGWKKSNTLPPEKKDQCNQCKAK